MGAPSLTLAETRNMFIFVSRQMQNKKDLLTQADKAIGDGDHGIGMTRGFEAVEQKLNKNEFESIGGLLQAVAKAAEHGMEQTKNMVAAKGKAKPLGNRAIGHPDPGALSTYLILSLMRAYLHSR
jgi:dihydroxyacetone kinase